MEKIPALITDNSEEVAQQSRRHADAVGGNVSPEIIDDILQFAADAELPDFYLGKEGEDLWYEMLKKDGLPAKVRKIADSWVKAGARAGRDSRAA